MKINTNKIFIFALSLCCISSLLSVDTKVLSAKEDTIIDVIKEDDYSIIMKETDEEIIQNIIYEDSISINGQIEIDNKVLDLDDYFNYESLSRFDLVNLLYEYAILTEEQKIECYCD